MTVTNLNPATDEDAIAHTVRRVFEEIAAATRKPDLTAVHEVIREAGIRNARRALAEAPDRLAEAQNVYREAQAVEAAAKERYSTALLEADWEIDGRFKTEGNQVYLRLTCDACGGTGTVAVSPGRGSDGFEKCDACDGIGTTRKKMSVEERKAYKASEAAKVPAVVAAALDLREAEEATAAARDAVTVSEKRLSACRADLEAACAELNALAAGLAAKGA